MPIVDRVTGFAHINGVSEGWGSFGARRGSARMGSLDGFGAVTACSASVGCSLGWGNVQKALNSRLTANGFRTLTLDGKRCCCMEGGAVLHGQTYNSLAWWVGPWKTSGSGAAAISTHLVNIQAQTRAFLVEPPNSLDVFAIQGALGLQQDGCLGPGTATKISEAVGAEWTKMPMKEVLARIKNPGAYTSSTSTGTATTAALAAAAKAAAAAAAAKAAAAKAAAKAAADKAAADKAASKTPPANGTAPSDEAPPGETPPGEAEQAAPARAAAFNFGKFALYSGVGIAALLVLAKFAKKKA